MNRIDELTGNDWVRERLMYVRYHGLSKVQANEVMLQQTHKDRDDLCNRYIQRNAGKEVI